MRGYFTVPAVSRFLRFLKFLRFLRPLLLSFCLWSCGNRTDKLDILFTGDLLLDRGVRQQIESKGADILFADLDTLFRSYDNVIVNLECPVTSRIAPVNKKFIFRGEPAYLPALKLAGITHTALANNHTCDQSREGIEDTYENLKSNGIIPFGAGANENKACSPAIIKKGKIKAAVFNSLFVAIENWVYLADSYGICQLSANELSVKISEFKKKNKDFKVIAFLHWGTEYQMYANYYQAREARMLIDSGADAVIGHHPHVIQNMEIYKGKPVFYSLGNFIFDSKRRESKKGMLVGLHISESGITFDKYEFAIERCVPKLF